MSDAQPLWSDEQIDVAAMDDWNYSTYFEAARSALRKMRRDYEHRIAELEAKRAEEENEYEANRRALNQRIDVLEARLAESQPAAQPSTPLAEIVAQLRSCGYECEAGALVDNTAWRELERMAGQPDVPTDAIDRLALLVEMDEDNEPYYHDDISSVRAWLNTLQQRPQEPTL